MNLAYLHVVINPLPIMGVPIGVGLLVPVALRATLVLFWLQMGGTFLTLVVLPERSFQRGKTAKPP